MKYIDSVISKKQRKEMDSWNHWFKREPFRYRTIEEIIKLEKILRDEFNERLESQLLTL